MRDRTQDNLVRVAAAMYSAGGPGDSGSEAPSWALRVDDALAALQSAAGRIGQATAQS